MSRTAKVAIVMGLMFGVIIGYMYQYNNLALEVDSLKSYINKLEQTQQTEVTDSTSKGQYTMITDLSSVMYVDLCDIASIMIAEGGEPISERIRFI